MIVGRIYGQENHHDLIIIGYDSIFTIILFTFVMNRNKRKYIFNIVTTPKFWL